MSAQFDAVAFDLDGTLYPNYRFFYRLIPFVLRDWPLLLAFAKAREALHAEATPPNATPNPAADFYEAQAALMAKLLGQELRLVKEKTERLIYRGWEPLFKRVALHPQVKETLAAFRDAGLKLGILSDFPLERKLNYLGLDGIWDAVICSEETGRLKPDLVPFRELERQLAVPASRILYVGNSVRYDIAGAKQAGMKAALIASRPKGRADFTFSAYLDLKNYVLQAPPPN
ncbi:MAG: HAD family hydrolase [Treponema sp.]|jgi:putative hydrolase of the HAD superfamily|nr:HAD family hydrolase [Treponema sp.]